ncbi:MAG TPA: CHRD domain-containing protein [Burkholderiales bacterium]|nr:CHRD domain-containing protein [Burkholderiales bacterium]HEU4922215.1 CHRD domain-containing protein [Burkholderiales bacterium]
MNKLIAKLILAGAALALSACSSMPDWMPGSGAIKVSLSGTEEVPPLTVPGSGSGSFRVADDGTITGSVTTKDVQGTMAHIHRGAKGTNGPVIVPLDKKGDTYSVPAGRKLTPEQLADLKAGRLYVNVHTERNKGGEVRGQLQP